MKQPDVSFLIPTWNRGELLADCLRALRALEGPSTWEAVVVDNGSVDRTLELLAQDFPEVRVIHNETNQGFARACNQALRVARGRYPTLLNNDVCLEPEALTSIVTFMDTHPETGISGGLLYDSPEKDRTIQSGCVFFPGLGRVLIQGASELLGLTSVLRRLGLSGLLFGSHLDPFQVQDVVQVSGALFVIRPEVLEQVGLLDEAFFVYLEETDLCRRAIGRGWKVKHNPGARGIHLCSRSADLLGDRVEVYARSMATYIEKYQGPTARRVYELYHRFVFKPLRGPSTRVRGALKRIFSGL